VAEFKRKTKLPGSACDWQRGGPSGYGNPVDLIREKLGIKGTKIPATMHGEWNIDGWKVVIKRSPPKGRRKSSKHRIYIRHNGDLIPAGRVRQALCRADVHKARRRAARYRGAKGRFTGRRRK
jgi:hypothetical protein